MWARTLVVVLLSLAAPLALAQDAPSEQAIARAAQRLVDPHADAADCRSLGVLRGEHRYECSVIECPGACQVVAVTVVLGYRGGEWRRISRSREDRGDTGQCGCCT